LFSQCEGASDGWSLIGLEDSGFCSLILRPSPTCAGAPRGYYGVLPTYPPITSPRSRFPATQGFSQCGQDHPSRGLIDQGVMGGMHKFIKRLVVAMNAIETDFQVALAQSLTGGPLLERSMVRTMRLETPAPGARHSRRSRAGNLGAD